MLTFIISLLVISAPFIWVWYKHWHNAKEAEKIYWYAKIKFEDECRRLGIRNDKQFSDMYTSSFIRCDDTKESIAVYAGQSNRFAVIPYRDYFAIFNGSKMGGVETSGNEQYVTTHIGNTAVSTRYTQPKVINYIIGYQPRIEVYCDKASTENITGYIFDSTGNIGRRMGKTKQFCEKAHDGMEHIHSYACRMVLDYKCGIYKKDDPGQSYLEWKKSHDEWERAQANKPDPYGSHSI